jgi:hypothetical protein
MTVGCDNETMRDDTTKLLFGARRRVRGVMVRNPTLLRGGRERKGRMTSAIASLENDEVVGT